jgi:hypothetical protein
MVRVLSPSPASIFPAATSFQKALIAMDEDGHLLMMRFVVAMRADAPETKPIYTCVFCGVTMTGMIHNVPKWRRHFNDGTCQKKACIQPRHDSDRLLLVAYLQELKVYNEAKRGTVTRPQEPQFTSIGPPSSLMPKRPNPFEETTSDGGPPLKRPRCMPSSSLSNVS